MTQTPANNSEPNEDLAHKDSAATTSSSLPASHAPRSDSDPRDPADSKRAVQTSASSVADAAEGGGKPAGETAAATTPTDLNIGQLIGTWRIEERLGSGAMASIYRGRDTENGAALAIKVLNNAADDVLQKRFRMEAQTVRSLDHPHIVKTIDSGQSVHGLSYIAMDLIEGEDLGTLLERTESLSVLDACRVLSPIADALAYAHDAGVIHRDVKPSNILLRRVPPGTPHSVQLSGMEHAIIPLLSDFGIARALDAPELTTAGRTIGTPAYMSPEQCAGNRTLDGRADLYSLGTVLYRCLVGRPPFVGATTQILHAHVYEALTIPEAVAAMLPPAILQVLQQSLQKDPAARYANSAELAAELALLLQQYPTPLQQQSATGADEAAESAFSATATMPSLPTTGTTATAAQVLVPGLHDSPPAPARKPNPVLAGTRTRTATRYPAVEPKSRTAPHRERGLLRIIPLGVLLATALLLVIFLLATTLNSDLLRFIPGVYLTTPAAVQLIDPPEADSVAGEGVAVTIAPPAPNGADAAPLSSSALPPTTTLTAVVATATPQRDTVQGTDDIDVALTWEDVLHYHRVGDWRQTRQSLMAMLSAVDGVPDLVLDNQNPLRQAQRIDEQLLSNSGAFYWFKWGDTFLPSQVRAVLVDTYVGLALEVNPPLQSPSVTDYLQAAVRLLNDDETSSYVRRLSATTTRYIDEPAKRDLWLDGMVAANQGYATAQAEEQQFCLAADALAWLDHYVANQPEPALLADYRTQCQGFLPVASEAEETEAAERLNGTIYYSTVVDGRYRILRVPLGTNGPLESATIVVEHGAQPALMGSQLSFYSHRSDSQGLSGVNLATPYQIDQRFDRYTGAVEDALNSPARWNPTATELVFSSRDESDEKPRVYTAAATFVANNSTKQVLGLGEDPAWSPDGSQIVFRDIGEQGNTPGLFLMAANGQGRTRLTTGKDHRPIWTPDGRSIVFMRQLDGDNWELYRLDLATGALARLTWRATSKDGLPALSPDGQTIVFASDQNDIWQLLTVPLAGGETAYLMPIEGSLEEWLEHAVQWVN